MHHYKRNISDWNDHTRHLTRLERSIYQDLFEMYLQTERPLPANIDQLARRILATAKQERQAVEAILAEFFTLKGEVYFHNGAQAIMKQVKTLSEKARASAESRWKGGAMRTHTDGNASGAMRTHTDGNASGAMRTHTDGNATQNPEPTTQNPEPNFYLTPSGRKKTGGTPAKQFFETLSATESSWFTDWALEWTVAQQRMDIDPFDAFLNFRDFHIANGNSKTDWRAAWKYWIREACKRAPKGFLPPQGGRAA